VRLAVLGWFLFTSWSNAHAQTRWRVDAKSSLAWWQVDPHLNHLWATTCPQDPSWRPGEGRSAGWKIDAPPDWNTHKDAAVSDTLHVPLYPRLTPRPLCSEAVAGTVVSAGDKVRGEVIIKADSLVTGESRRDKFARDAAFQTTSYPDIRFRIDSLVDTRRAGDTLRGRAVGVLSLRGHEQAFSATVVTYPDSEAGGTRVLARLRAPARQFVSDFWPDCLAQRSCLFGLGVRMNLWQTFFMGVDLLLQPDPAEATLGRE